LTSIAILGSACGGQDRSSPPTTTAVESTPRLATLEGLLPGELGTVRLRREAFTGSVWLRASPEEASNNGILFATWSDHISARELAELIPRLP
jgi:hypothetical protein